MLTDHCEIRSRGRGGDPPGAYRYKLVATAVLFLLAGLRVHAMDSAFEDARLVENAGLDYPPQAYQSGQEGWTLLSYVVTTDGSVVDPLVEDSSGLEAFDQAAVQSVLNLRYKPATLDGTATERCFTQHKVTFRKPPGRYSVARKFENRLTEVGRLIEDGKLDVAASSLASLARDHPRNLYEDAWYWLTHAKLMRARGNVDDELASLRKAVAYEGMYLPDTVYVSALKRLYTIESQGGQLAAAFATSDRLVATKVAADGVDDIAAHARDLQSTLTGLEFFSTRGQIAPDRLWRHPLLRSKFSFLVESGELRNFDLRCSAHRTVLEITPEAAWKIPASWGDCTLYVNGQAGTVFYVNELL